jgi:hypothetical protein
MKPNLIPTIVRILARQVGREPLAWLQLPDRWIVRFADGRVREFRKDRQPAYRRIRLPDYLKPAPAPRRTRSRRKPARHIVPDLTDTLWS